MFIDFVCHVVLMAPAEMGQADNPTIAILRFGALPSLDITMGAVLDLLGSGELRGYNLARP